MSCACDVVCVGVACCMLVLLVLLSKVGECVCLSQPGLTMTYVGAIAACACAQPAPFMQHLSALCMLAFVLILRGTNKV
jgi:hypothetical protein